MGCLLVPDAALLDTLSLSINVDSTDVQAHSTVPEFPWNDVVVKRTELNATALGRATTVNLQSLVLTDALGEEPLGIEAELVGKDIWEASLILRGKGRAPFVWKMEAEPMSTDQWECSILEWMVPTPGSVLKVEDTLCNGSRRPKIHFHRTSHSRVPQAG